MRDEQLDRRAVELLALASSPARRRERRAGGVRPHRGRDAPRGRRGVPRPRALAPRGLPERWTVTGAAGAGARVDTPGTIQSTAAEASVRVDEDAPRLLLPPVSAEACARVQRALGRRAKLPLPFPTRNGKISRWPMSALRVLAASWKSASRVLAGTAACMRSMIWSPLTPVCAQRRERLK